MENALWNGELIMASEVEKQYEVEKRIRVASSRKELRCQDSNCSNPIIRYCHGDNKSAYFAHINNVNCDYSKFEKNDTQILRNIRRKTYEHFLNEGYNIKIEAKVLPHHYSHFIFDFGDKYDIIYNKTSSNLSFYISNIIDNNWIIMINSI